MKIGIITFHWSNNYGAVLQAHAMQSFLKQNRHDVEIIDYRAGFYSSWPKKWLSKTPAGFVRKFELAYKQYLFDTFRTRYLKRTQKVFYSLNDLKCLEDIFDVLITGSDQVWNPQFLSQFDELFDIYFLTFVSPKTRRISYASSFGHSHRSTIKEEWQRIVGDKLKCMDAISVRETSGISLVKDLSGRNDAVNVVDPTLLLDCRYYEQMAEPAKTRNSFLFSFILHGQENAAAAVCQQYSLALNLTVLKCDALKTAFHRGYTLPSPTRWLGLIRGASFVVTNSFHCVLFCLIYHTQFISLHIDGELAPMNSRLLEFLRAVGLLHRIINPHQVVPIGIVEEQIHWSDVDMKIAQMRNDADGFLRMCGV